MRILLLDGEQRSALASVRALGRAGHHVSVASHDPRPLAGASRHAAATLPLPSPETAPADYVAAVTALARQHASDLVLPLTELSCRLVNTDAMRKLCIVPLPPEDLIARLRDKWSACELAEQFGIDIPPTHLSRAPHADLDPDSLDYPLWVKPRESWVLDGDAWRRLAVCQVQDAAALRALLADQPEYAEQDLLLQQDVEGQGEGVFSLYHNGQDLGWLGHRRVREKPPQGGVSVVCETRPLPAELLAKIRALLEHLDWQGVVMMEFRRTPDGRYVLMEANTRLWGSLQLAVHAGVNFPVLLVDAFAGQQPAPVTRYRLTRMRWHLGELDRTWLVVKDPQTGACDKLRALLGLLIPNLGGCSDVWSWDDRGPVWRELSDWLRALRPA